MSGLASTKGQVKIDDEEFILVEESYRKKAQQPFSPRFATGDPTEGDNSFWQFLSQKGWASEGQRKFTDTARFKQSAGWDFRQGRARIALGTETVAKTNSLVDPYTAIAAYLLENFATGTIDWTKWNDGNPGGNAGVIAAQAGAYGVRSGYSEAWTTSMQGTSVLGGQSWQYAGTYDTVHGVTPSLGSGGNAPSGGDPGYGTSEPARAFLPARGSSLTFTYNWQANHGSQRWLINTGGGTIDSNYTTYQIKTRTQRLFQVGKTGMALQSVGDWSFDLYCRNNDDNIHAAFAFLINSTGGGGYVLEISGAGVTTAKLFKTTGTTAWNTTGQTLLKTWTLAGSMQNVKTTLKISIAGGNVFSLYQDGVLVGGGTATDTTYTTGDAIRIVTGYTDNGDTTISNINIPSSAAGAYGVTGKFIHYLNKLVLAYRANGVSDFTFSTIVTAAQASNQPGIQHVSVGDAAVWTRDADPTGGLNSVTAQSRFLATVAGTTLNIYHGTTLVYTDGLAGTGTLVVPVNSTTLLVAGTTSADNTGIPFIQRFVFTANTWTLSTEKICHFDGGVTGTVPNTYAFDSNGVLYFGTVDMSGTAGSMPSRVIRITSTDLLATQLTATDIITISDFMIRGLFSLNGSVYLFGAWLEGGLAYGGIAKWPGTEIYRSTKGVSVGGGTDAEVWNFGIASVWASSRSVRFLSATDLELLDPVLEMDTTETVREVASFDSAQLEEDGPNVLAICEWNGQFYCLNAVANTIQRTKNTRGGFASGTLAVELSEMGGNTSLIQKTLHSVIVEVDEAVPASYPLTVYVNGSSVGTLASTDGTRKEIVLATELTSATFDVKITSPAASEWDGELKAVMLKYVPTQFKKRAWAMGLRCTNSLRMIDGKKCAVAAADLLAALWTAWASNTPVTFVDLDGTSYSVLVTDIQENRPLIPEDQAKLEALAFVELLEV